MAASRPRTMEELAAIDGVGAQKLKHYGAAMLAAIREHGTNG